VGGGRGWVGSHTFGMHKQQSHTAYPPCRTLSGRGDIFPYFTQQKQCQTQLLPQLAVTFSPLTTDRNFKFNSPFSEPPPTWPGTQTTHLTTESPNHPSTRPLNAILWLFFAAFVAGFLRLFYYVHGKCEIPEDILLCNFLTSR